MLSAEQGVFSIFEKNEEFSPASIQLTSRSGKNSIPLTFRDTFFCVGEEEGSNGSERAVVEIRGEGKNFRWRP